MRTTATATTRTPRRVRDEDLTDRLTKHFATCSTTPRSGQAYVQQLAQQQTRACNHETLYAEAKLALAQEDFSTARELFHLCPSTYKRTKAYLHKCDTFDRLCLRGVVRRPELDALVTSLVTCLHEDDPSDATIVSYAERLWKDGYTRNMVDGSTLRQVDALARSARFSSGHEERFVQHVKDASFWWECVVYDLCDAVKKCGGVGALAKTVAPFASPTRGGGE